MYLAFIHFLWHILQSDCSLVKYLFSEMTVSHIYASCWSDLNCTTMGFLEMSGIAKLYLSPDLKCQLSFKCNVMGIIIMLRTYADCIYIIKDSAEILTLRHTYWFWRAEVNFLKFWFSSKVAKIHPFLGIKCKASHSWLLLGSFHLSMLVALNWFYFVSLCPL